MNDRPPGRRPPRFGNRTPKISRKTHPFLWDHRLEGRAVYPAAEEVRALAAAARETYPGASVRSSRDAKFPRFLPLPDRGKSLAAEVELTRDGAGEIRASLQSIRQGRTTGITRRQEHASVVFDRDAPPAPLPTEVACAVAGICRKIDSKALYRGTAGFGPAYRNVTGVLYLSEDGASAYLKAPRGDRREGPLGSPFVIDAAFQAASAWGQGCTGRVTIPVGYGRRFVRKPTAPGGRYYCRVIPKNTEGETRFYDLWIYGLDGELFETVIGLEMRDVFRGRLPAAPGLARPPERPLGNLENKYPGMAVIDLDAPAPFSRLLFSASQASRYQTLGDKRKRGYAGARIGEKRLARKLEGVFSEGNPAVIRTASGRKYRVSAAHDSRYAVVAAGSGPVGVDVEPEDDRILKCGKIFLSDNEYGLAAGSPLGKTAGLLRVWEIKEAAAKALGIALPRAWKKAEVRKIGAEESIVKIGRKTLTARHASAGGHLFTILELKH